MDKILIDLINSFRVSGNEFGAREVIIDYLRDVKCNIEEDCMGNLVVNMGRGGEEKIMFSANMDEIGLMITYIEDNGFLRVTNVGDFMCKEVIGSFVEFSNGVKGRVILSKEKPTFQDVFIDIMVEDKAEALKFVKEGDVCRFESLSIIKEEKIQAQGLNNALGCYALLKTIKELEKTSKECYFVFSSQGELQGRGGRAAAYNINPASCIVVTTHEAGDYIDGKGTVKLGEGPVLRVKDKNLIISQEIRNIIEGISKTKEIELQLDVGTEISEGGSIHKERGGIKTAVLAVPVRYKKSLIQMAVNKDIENLVKILKELC